MFEYQRFYNLSVSLLNFVGKATCSCYGSSVTCSNKSKDDATSFVVHENVEKLFQGFMVYKIGSIIIITQVLVYCVFFFVE